MILTENEIADIKKRADAATPGPFQSIVLYSDGGDDGDSYAEIQLRKKRGKKPIIATRKDFDLFMTASTYIPALITSHEELRKKFEIAMSALQFIDSWDGRGNETRIARESLELIRGET